VLLDIGDDDPDEQLGAKESAAALKCHLFRFFFLNFRKYSPHIHLNSILQIFVSGDT